MTRIQPRPAKKIATLGLAGTVVTTTMTGLALTADASAPQLDELECWIEEPSHADAPTQADIERAENAVEEAERVESEAIQAETDQKHAIDNATEALEAAQREDAAARQRAEDQYARAEEELAAEQARQEAEAQKAAEEEDKARRILAEKTAQESAAREEKQRLEAERDSARARVEEAAGAVDSAAQPQDRPADNQPPQASDITRKIAELETEKQQLTDDIRNKTAERERLIAERQEAQRNVDSATTDQTAAQEALEAARADRDNKAQEKTQAEQRAQEAQAALKQAEAEEGTESEAYQRHAAELAQAEQNIQNAETALQNAQADIERLSGQIEQAQTDETRLNEQAQATEERIATLTNQITELDGQIAQRQTVLDEKNAELDRLKVQLADVNTQIAREEAADPTAHAYERNDLVNARDNVVETALYRVENGQAVRVTELESAPTDLDNYILRSRTESGKILTSHVTSLVKDDSAGAPQYRVEGNLAENTAAERATTAVVAQKPAPQAGVVTTFKELVEALRNGVESVRLARDLYADELPSDKESATYVAGAYSGVLDGDGHKIIGLEKPLFASLDPDTTVQNLELSEVQINSQQVRAAALAERATSTIVKNVHVSGTINGSGSVAGVVAEAMASQLTNVTVRGTLRSTHNLSNATIGGLVGRLDRGTITASGFHGDIYAIQPTANGNRLGGLVGHLNDQSRLTQVYAGGTIHNLNDGGQVGGLVGSTWSSNRRHGSVDNALSAMSVTGGKLIHGDSGFDASFRNTFAWENEASGAADRRPYATVLAPADAQARYADNIALSRDIRSANKASASTQASGLQAGKEQAYANYLKLLPYATREALVKAANSVADDDPLVSKELLSVMPTVAGKVTSDSVHDKERIDGLILHFADRTVERRALALDNREETRSDLGYYYMNGGLPYTPDQWHSVDGSSLAALADELRSVTWDSIPPTATISSDAWTRMVDQRHTQAVAEAQRNNKPVPTREQTEEAVLADHRGLLYLREPFARQQAGLEEQLRSMIARESVVSKEAFNQAAVERKIRDNKTAILLGLAYINKWYDIDFNGVNLRDVLVFHRDYYGAADASPLDILIRLGSSYDLLDPRKNVETYHTLNYHNTHHLGIHNELDELRQQFTQYASFDDWFKATTKAYIVEAPSQQRPDVNVQLTKRLIEMKHFSNMILPLLTVSENTIWATVHMSSFAMGSFEKYYDVLKVTTPEDVERHATRIRGMVDLAAKKYREYYDLWYRIGNDTMKRNLIRDLPVWDGFSYAWRWTNRYGPNNFRSVEEFYGPVGRWFAANGTAGYANGYATFMVVDGMLHPGNGGLVTYTHEQVHNFDGGVHLGGHGRRTGSRPELYPTSLLQNAHHRAHDEWGFNQADYFENQNPQNGYMHNLNPSRFQTVTDLNQYYKGYFDALYLLDNAEAEVLLRQTDEDKAKLLGRLGNHAFENRRHLNSYDSLTAQDVAEMNLTSIQDLVENELMLSRRLKKENRVLPENGYYGIPVLDPFYGTAESNLGITGESVFRRNAFELLAAKGYTDGWMPYVSNQYAAEARAAGQPNLPDTFIMPKIFAEEGYTSLKQYRKQAYAANRERAQTQLKPITLTYQGQQVTITSYEQMVAMFTALMAEDLRNGHQNNERHSKVYALKKALFSKLMEQTDEFRSSIFRDGDADLVPWTAPPEEKPIVSPAPVLLPQPVKEIVLPRFDTATLPTPRNNERLEQLRAQRADLTRQIAALEDEIRQLEAQQAQARSAKSTAEQGKTSAQAELQTLRDQAQAKRTEKADLERQLREAQARQQRATADKAAAEEQRRRAETEMAAMRARVQTRRDALAAAQENLRQRQTAFDAAQQAVVQAEERQRRTEENLAAARRAVEDATQRIEQLQSHLAQSESRLAAKDPEIARLRELLALIRVAQAAQQALVAANEKLAASATRLNEAEQASSKARDALAAASTQAEQKQARRDALAGQTVDSLLNDATPAQPYPDLRAAIDDLREALRQHEAKNVAVVAARAAVDQAQQAYPLLLARRDHARQQLEAARQELARLLALKAESDGRSSIYECVSKNPPVVHMPEAEIGVASAQPPVVDLPVAEIGVSSAKPPIVELPVADIPQVSTDDGLVFLLQPTQVLPPREENPDSSILVEAPVYDIPSLSAHGKSVLAQTGSQLPAIGTAALAAAAAGVILTRRRRDS